LHEYAKQQVQAAKPAMKPEIYGVRQGIKIVLTKAKLDRKLEYRLLVEKYAHNGEISIVRQGSLELKREEWGLPDEVATAIENEVLEPDRKRLRNLQRYQRTLENAARNQFPLTQNISEQLKDFQEELGLRDEDVKSIHDVVIATFIALEQERQRQAALERQSQLEAEELESGLQLRQMQQSQREAKDREKQSELERQNQAKAERLRQAELKKQQDLEAEQAKRQRRQSEAGQQSQEEEPKQPNRLRLTRRNFMVIAGLSGVSVVAFAAIRGNSSKVSPIIISPPQPFTADLGNGANLEMLYIRNGKFTMGSPPEEKGDEDERPQIKDVNISAFYMGKNEVTQAQWQAIMGNNPSKFQESGQNPVELVSWNDAQEFCKKLSQKAGRQFRLPSEAEWEYACRAGTTTAYSFGNDASQLGEYAWYDGNSENKTHPVGQKKPNAFGLYDMHGNVWEWCQDVYGKYGDDASDRIRKIGKAVGNENDNQDRLLRGGSWSRGARVCRSAIRIRNTADLRHNGIGFRVVCADV
jgi:formylglycine-generating enzyme required for sulfatase activity